MSNKWEYQVPCARREAAASAAEDDAVGRYARQTPTPKVSKRSALPRRKPQSPVGMCQLRRVRSRGRRKATHHPTHMRPDSRRCGRHFSDETCKPPIRVTTRDD